MRKAPIRRQNSNVTGLVLFAAGIVIASCTTESTLGPIGNTQPTADGQSKVAATSEGQATDIECPTVTVRTGASTFHVPPSAGPTDVRYQGALGQLARECAILGETMTMRVGVEGRLLVGPKGGPGNVSVPLRIALVAEGPEPKPLWTKLYSVPVEVPQNASQAVFSQVEDDLTFPLPADRNIENYIVYVGFDPKGDTSRPAPKAKKPRPRPKPKPTAAKPAAPVPAPEKAPAQTPPPAKQQPQFEPPPGQPAAKQPQFEPAPSPPPGVFAPPPGQGG